MRTIAVFAACVLAAGSAGAQRLFDYSGPDRMAKITAAAKKEGTVTMYTTFAEKDQPTLIRPFEAKYGVKVGMEAKNEEWFASVVDVMGGGEKGLQFFRDLVARNGISARTGHTLLNNMVIAGEVPLALTVYNYMPEQAKKKGAPIDWFALEPAVARSNAIGVARRAPHPGAALLFYEYMLGEGQQYLVKMDYVPSNTKVSSPLKNVKILQTDPIRSLDETDKWTKLFEDVVLKRPGN